jgi:selenide,water dikinase
VLRRLKPSRVKQALVGFSTSDDAAVYRLSKNLAIVETVDFFPPVVDDPHTFGEIAAANALSDIWAMGGKPLFALNLVAFPNGLPLEMLSEILAGGQRKAEEAGIPILGGHSIQDPEPKYGMAVTGTVHPKRILTNSGARPGDVLILTKPIGSGIATTAIKRGNASEELSRRVIALMTQLNKAAGEVFASPRHAVHALTDVTGYGLLGHLWEMMKGAGTRAMLNLAAIPVLTDVPALAAEGVVPGGTKANLEWVAPHVRFPAEFPEPIKLVLADAQTNGGLLAAVPARRAQSVVKALDRAGVSAAVIGQVKGGRPGIDVIA